MEETTYIGAPFRLDGIDYDLRLKAEGWGSWIWITASDPASGGEVKVFGSTFNCTHGRGIHAKNQFELMVRFERYMEKIGGAKEINAKIDQRIDKEIRNA